jgi:hypothetical protein
MRRSSGLTGRSRQGWQTQWLNPSRGIAEEKRHLLGRQRAELTIEHCHGDPSGVGVRPFNFNIGHRFVGMDVGPSCDRIRARPGDGWDACQRPASPA